MNSLQGPLTNETQIWTSCQTYIWQNGFWSKKFGEGIVAFYVMPTSSYSKKKIFQPKQLGSSAHGLDLKNGILSGPLTLNFQQTSQLYLT